MRPRNIPVLQQPLGRKFDTFSTPGLTDGSGNSRLQPDHGTITCVIDTTWVNLSYPHSALSPTYGPGKKPWTFWYQSRKKNQFLYGKLQVFRLRLKEISHFYIKWPNANSSRARISLLYGANFSHCAINNNSGPGINSPTSHQNPGFRGPTAHWCNRGRNGGWPQADIRKMVCFRTSISIIYPFLKCPRLPRTSCFPWNANLYFVYTTPKSDVRKNSAVPDMSTEI